MLYRCIAPQWSLDADPGKRRVVEGDFTEARAQDLNANFYNIYFLPNYPSQYEPGTKVDGTAIDTFEYVFVDMDLKDNKYPDKDSFVAAVCGSELVPTRIVDSGNGIHVYWKVSDLDAMSYLRLSRRLMRLFHTDEAVGQIYQLMRAWNTVNVKNPNDFKVCELLFEGGSTYNCETLDKLLPPITLADEEYCRQHFDRTYNKQSATVVDVALPPKFARLIKDNTEVKEIWSGDVDDRSKADWRLAHIMLAHGFTRDEAMSVLVNCAKALSRAPAHRVSYAENIVDKVWTHETKKAKGTTLDMSRSVKDILSAPVEHLKGSPLRCWRYIDATYDGFRLGHVIGLVAGSGVGKTAMALNMFKGFVSNNPNYDHFIVPLEQPAQEIAVRWRKMCGESTFLHEKVQVLSNYNDDGSYRHLALEDIKDYILRYQKETGRKVGCVVIDHIGVLRKKGKSGENQDLIEICKQMKSFAVETNTLLVMQSQAPREKAGIGDLELDKSAAYGTVFFESFVDYLLTIWQPLKRAYSDKACPTVTAFKYCKIRHKNRELDEVQEDVAYRLFFDSKTELMRELTEKEEKSFAFFNQKCVSKRKLDRSTDLGSYQGMKWLKND